MSSIFRSMIATVAVGMMMVGPSLAGKKDDTLNISWVQGLESLDIYFSTAREMIPMSKLLFDTLIDRSPSGEFVPLLATSFKYLDDKTLEFELRQDVTFHDGSHFTADDAVYTLNWVADPKNGVLHQENVNWIDNVEKTGDHTVRIHMKRPFPAALEYLAGPLPIYPKGYYEEVGPEGMGSKPVGSGPYKLAEMTPGAEIKLVRNPDYFEGGPKRKPEIGAIAVRTVPELNTQLVELISGQTDWIWRVPNDQAEKLADRGGLTVVSESTMRIGYIQFDAVGKAKKDSPLTKLKVRQAISYAINREAIAENLVGGSSDVVNAFCHPVQFGCTDDLPHYEYDPQKARSLLADAGYGDGFDIELHAYRDRRFAEAVMSDLEAVGIRPTLSYMNYATLRDLVDEGKVSMNFMTWGSNSIADVSAITPHFFTGGPADYAEDEEVKRLLDDAELIVDGEARLSLYQKALSRIAEQAYMLPLFTYPVNYAYSSDLDFTPTSDEIPQFYSAKWK